MSKLSDDLEELAEQMGRMAARVADEPDGPPSDAVGFAMEEARHQALRLICAVEDTMSDQSG